jgi:hypothetical protein
LPRVLSLRARGDFPTTTAATSNEQIETMRAAGVLVLNIVSRRYERRRFASIANAQLSAEIAVAVRAALLGSAPEAPAA